MNGSHGRRLIWCAAVVLIVAGASLATGPRAQDAPPPLLDPQNEARQYQQQALAAYQRKDYLAFVENMQKAVQLLPDHPGMIYRLAVASALVGNKEDALAQLGRLVSMSIVEEISGDPDFDSVKDSPEFARIVEAMKGLKTRVGSSALAFRLAEKDLIPEGLAHDSVSGDYFVGSVHKRKILRVSKRGKAQDFTSEKQDGLWAVLGMKVDAQRRALWACSSAVPQMKDAVADDLGRATLFKFDLNTGALVKKYPLGGGAAGHNCNDLALSAQGDVFVSDAESSEVLRLAPGAESLVPLVPAGQLRSPQGLALSDDEKYLFVADYGTDILRVELATNTFTRMTHPPYICLLGTDGMVFKAGSLIAIQNGITPHRVVRFNLNPGMDAVVSAKILEMNNALFDEPTLGTLTDKGFFYVANSQWSRFEKDGTIFPPNRLAEPVILKLELK